MARCPRTQAEKRRKRCCRSPSTIHTNACSPNELFPSFVNRKFFSSEREWKRNRDWHHISPGVVLLTRQRRRRCSGNVRHHAGSTQCRPPGPSILAKTKTMLPRAPPTAPVIKLDLSPFSNLPEGALYTCGSGREAKTRTNSVGARAAGPGGSERPHTYRRRNAWTRAYLAT